MRSYNLAEIAENIGGTLHGSPDLVVHNIKPLEEASKNDISFFAPTSKKEHKKLFQMAIASQAAAIVVPEINSKISAAQIVSEKPMLAIIRLAQLFKDHTLLEQEIHNTVQIDPSAEVSNNVSIGAFTVIGKNCSIGENTKLFPHVTIYPGVKIGANCTIHSGATIRENVVIGDDCIIQNGVVIGADGFGYLPIPEKGHQRIPHIGNVVIQDSVDVGANSTIDRATFGQTRISKMSKLDNLVMIGHNVQIGERSLLCGQVGVSGSSKIGTDVTLAGQTGVADHCVVGNKVRAAGKTGITSNIEDNTDVAGFPALPIKEWRRISTSLKRLPELIKKLKKNED